MGKSWLVFIFALIVISNSFGYSKTKSPENTIEKNKILLNEIQFSFPEKKTASPSSKIKTQKNETTSMSFLKKEEISKQWELCLAHAQKEFQSQKIVRDWVLLTWVHCTEKALEERHNPKIAGPVLLSIEKNRELLLTGPAKTQILQGMFHLRTLLAELFDKQDLKIYQAFAKENLDILLSYGDRIDHETRAKVFYYVAGISQNNHQLKAAKQFLEQSLTEKESKAAREKLNSVQLALGNRDENEAKEKGIGSISSTGSLLLPELEAKAEERLDQSLQANDLITYIEDGVSYLKKFPNGRRAKSVQDKILEIYNQINDHALSSSETDSPRFIELRERALSLMEKTETQRQLDWARSMHRRGDFAGSLRLAEKCYSAVVNSPQSTTLLWILGRSSQFLGVYAKAQKYFEQYIELNSGGEEFSEIQMRLALVYIREHQYSSAVATLEKLLLNKNLDRYELLARYWLIRSLQAEKNERAQSEMAALIDKFPFSYYGIRLRAELNQGQLNFPESVMKGPEFETSLYFTDFQKKIIDRVNFLAENGWYLEAQKEILELPSVKDPYQKLFLAKRWSAAKAFPLVVKLTNEAGDLDPHLRALDLIAVSFPQEYKTQIQREADRNQLSAFLVKSVIRQESAFGVQAVSSSGALGLMQLIPPTANEVAQDLHLGKINVPEDVFDSDVNIQMGSFYLAKMIKKFGGSVPLGLAAYNAGPHRLQSFVMGRPEVAMQMSTPSSDPNDEIWIDELPWYETSFYVKSILRNTLIYKILEQGKVSLSSVIWSDLVLSRAKDGTL